MNRTLFFAAVFAASSGAAAVGAAATFATQPYVGSDVQYNVTNEAILQSGLGNQNANNSGSDWNPKTNAIGDYSAGGSGLGESAMAGARQYTAPMYRMLKGAAGKNACSAAQSFLQEASGIVTGIDAVRIYGSAAVLNNTATCNANLGTPCTSDPSGIAFSNTAPGAAALGLSNWRDVLALLYGGMDRSTGFCSNNKTIACDPHDLAQADINATCGGTSNTCAPVVNCNSSKRQTLVNNWAYLFNEACPNQFSSNVNPSATSGFCPDGSTCNPSDAQPSCSDGISTCVGFGSGLTHAWRRDDSAGVADVFSRLLLIQGAASYDQFGNVIPAISLSGSGVNGFGVSPYCNSLNWDWTEQGSSNTGSCDDGSVPNCTTGQLCADGTYCLVQCPNAAGKHFVGPGGVPAPTAADATQFHHIPPVTCGSGTGTDWRCGGTANVTSAVWGYPQGVALETAVAQPQVQPTSYQDNDPIRTPCLGTGVANRPAENVCNTDGKLGVVIAVPSLSFIKNVAGGTQEFPALTCNGPSQFTNAPNIYKCAPLKSHWASGLCPNNDNGACYVPTNKTGSTQTTQCLATKQTAPPCQKGNCAQDGRVYNLSAFTVPAAGGNASFVTFNVGQVGSPATFPFMGAFARIHEANTSQNKCATGGAPCTQAGSTCANGSQCISFLTACQLDDATDMVGCLAQADPNSVGFGGNPGDTWEARSQVAINANEAPSGNTQGIRVDGLAAGASCTPTVATNASNQYVPNPAANYPLWSKMYFNSLQGFGVVNGLNTSGNPSSEAEIQLAQWESTAANISPVMSTFGFFVLPQSPQGQDTTGAGATITQCNPPTSPTNTLNEGTTPAGCYTVTVPAGQTGFYKPFCEDFDEFKICGYSGSTQSGGAGAACNPATGNCNGCNNNASVTGIPGDPSPDPNAASVSTVCGNGIVELFEDCDFNAPAGANPSGCICSNTCRCSGGVF
jgi:hypothetical protein